MKRLVLLGGGHSHVHVLDAFARQPPKDAAVTLLTPGRLQIYSGMLPGWLAGHYRLRECAIPVAALARRAGARFVRGHAVGLDTRARRVLCADGACLPYDLLSIDTGAVADLATLPGAEQHVLPVRPIDRFVHGCAALLAQAEARPHSTITLIGGGAAGVELALALHHRLRREADGGRLHLRLVSAGERLLPGHPARVGALLARHLALCGIELRRGRRVVACRAGGLVLDGGEEIASDFTLAATGAKAPSWPAAAGLAVDDTGFIRVDACLQSFSHPEVFAAGDVAAMEGQPRPKSGVHAVRAGPPLARNLRLALDGRPLQPHLPQRRALCLVATGGRHAVASWGPLAWQGDWVWRWKDRIDRAFITRFAADVSAPLNLPAGEPSSHGDSLRS